MAFFLLSIRRSISSIGWSFCFVWFQRLISTASVRDNGNSPLLSLPAEIRAIIWEYALGGMQINIEVARERSSYINNKTTPLKSNLTRGINLPRVCRQIYSEIGAIVYRHNVFSFADYEALLAFRSIFKQPQWESVYTIAVSVSMAQRLYAPLVDSPSSLNCEADHLSGDYLGTWEFIVWQNDPTRRWTTFSTMFDNVHTMIVRSSIARAKVDGLLAFAKSKESAEEIIYE